jgi:Spy/CpxP family protein refolding chaperone
MKKINFLSLIFTCCLIALTFVNIKAQEEQPQTDNPNQADRPFKIFEELGLTREQIQQIRRINQERKPIMQQAQRNWRQANRALDLAIYADDSSDELVKDLTRQAQNAQSELLRERTSTEYLIRKVLTPEQLVKFRELREQIRQRINNLKKQNKQNTQSDEPQRPLNRFGRRKNQNRPQ